MLLGNSLFEKQDQKYQHEVLLHPLSASGWLLKSGSPIGGTNNVTDEETTLSMNRFGSWFLGSGEEAMAYFGFTVENVVKKAKSVPGRSA